MMSISNAFNDFVLVDPVPFRLLSTSKIAGCHQ